MTRMVSIGTKVTQLQGLLGTGDLNDWETQFVRSVAQRYNGGTVPGVLSDKQVESLERIWDKHFA